MWLKFKKKNNCSYVNLLHIINIFKEKISYYILHNVVFVFHRTRMALCHLDKSRQLFLNLFKRHRENFEGNVADITSLISN